MIKNKTDITKYFYVAALTATTLFGNLFAAGSGGYPSPHLLNDAVLNFSDWTSFTSNPALLTEVDQKEVTVGGLRLAADAGYSFASLAVPLLFDHTVAVTFFSSSLDNIIQTNSMGSIENGTISFGDLNLVMSYAYRVLPYLSLGTNASIILRDLGVPENIAAATATAKKGLQFGVGFDFGVIYNPINHYRYGNLNLGLNLQNLINTGVKEGVTSTSKTRYPINLRTSVSYRALRNRLVLHSEITIEDIIPDPSDFNLGYDSTQGLLIQHPKVSPIIPSGGVRYFIARGLGVKAGYNNNALPFIGVVLSGKRINVFRQLRMDYDFWYNDDGVGYSNMLKVAARIGKTREELGSKRMYSTLIIAPMNDFNEAMRLYLTGKYWEAAFAFGKVIALYPGFHKIDMAALYMGKSYEYMEMNKAARDLYEDALKKYTTSDMRPRYIYQLQNLDYKEGNYDRALKNYAFISNIYSSSAIKADADYIAGQIYYKKNNYTQAKLILEKVPATDESYGYAQYTLGMISLRKNKTDEAIQHLTNVTNILPKTSSEQVLKEAAFCKLGHIYFEDVKLKEALTMYKKVPVTSQYADEALLASAWCYIKTNRREMFNGAIEFLDQIIQNQPKSVLIPEVYLAKGYCYSQLAEFPKATDMFKQCIKICNTSMLSETQIKNQLNKFSNTKENFSLKEKEIMANALQKPSEKVLSTREVMSKMYDNFKENRRQELLFSERVKRIRMFRSSRDKTLRDAKFALATVNNLAKSRKKEAVLKRYEAQEKEIDSEMEQIKRELEALEGK